MSDFSTIFVTGGAGFVGSNLAIWLKREYPSASVIAADNLKRRGSELNLPRLKAGGVEFVHCDIRNLEDLEVVSPKVDLILECSAEPSVLAGYDESPEYVVRTNLGGTANCLELARRRGAAFVFLSTSRVYPIRALNSVRTDETETRLALAPEQTLPGASAEGIAEDFPLNGPRSLYGATKLASELLIQEYGDMYRLPFVINRCGVIAGPWQMGRVDQGVFALWVARHHFGGDLAYIGWGGNGKQLRDLLHVDDLAELIGIEIQSLENLSGKTFNVGGGASCSLSLQETTAICRELTGRRLSIRSEPETRAADIKIYVSDNRRVSEATGWRPKRSPHDILRDIHEWIRGSEDQLRSLWA